MAEEAIVTEPHPPSSTYTQKDNVETFHGALMLNFSNAVVTENAHQIADVPNAIPQIESKIFGARGGHSLDRIQSASASPPPDNASPQSDAAVDYLGLEASESSWGSCFTLSKHRVP
jgi:hypothetical protein